MSDVRGQHTYARRMAKLSALGRCALRWQPRFVSADEPHTHTCQMFAGHRSMHKCLCGGGLAVSAAAREER